MVAILSSVYLFAAQSVVLCFVGWLVGWLTGLSFVRVLLFALFVGFSVVLTYTTATSRPVLIQLH